MTSVAHRFRVSTRSDFLQGHPIICDMLPPFDNAIIKCHFDSLSSSLVALMSWIRASAVAAALGLGRYSLTPVFKLVSSCTFTSLTGTSQWSSNGYCT